MSETTEPVRQPLLGDQITINGEIYVRQAYGPPGYELPDGYAKINGELYTKVPSELNEDQRAVLRYCTNLRSIATWSHLSPAQVFYVQEVVFGDMPPHPFPE